MTSLGEMGCRLSREDVVNKDVGHFDGLLASNRRDSVTTDVAVEKR